MMKAGVAFPDGKVFNVSKNDELFRVFKRTDIRKTWVTFLAIIAAGLGLAAFGFSQALPRLGTPIGPGTLGSVYVAGGAALATTGLLGIWLRRNIVNLPLDAIEVSPTAVTLKFRGLEPWSARWDDPTLSGVLYDFSLSSSNRYFTVPCVLGLTTRGRRTTVGVSSEVAREISQAASASGVRTNLRQTPDFTCRELGRAAR